MVRRLLKLGGTESVFFRTLNKTFSVHPPSQAEREQGLWPGPIWAVYRLNGSLKTGFTTNRFYSVSGNLENGPNRIETGQIFPKRAEKNPGSPG